MINSVFRRFSYLYMLTWYEYNPDDIFSEAFRCSVVLMVEQATSVKMAAQISRDLLVLR